jgi:hypothetical protein
MALYFSWEHPLFTSLSREHFMNDFHQGNHRFCSPLLVNAMLALGSCWDEQTNLQSKLTDVNAHGDRFFEESVRLLGEEVDRRSLSTVQALGIMASGRSTVDETSRDATILLRVYGSPLTWDCTAKLTRVIGICTTCRL